MSTVKKPEGYDEQSTTEYRDADGNVVPYSTFVDLTGNNPENRTDPYTLALVKRAKARTPATETTEGETHGED